MLSILTSNYFPGFQAGIFLLLERPVIKLRTFSIKSMCSTFELQPILTTAQKLVEAVHISHLFKILWVDLNKITGETSCFVSAHIYKITAHCILLLICTNSYHDFSRHQSNGALGVTKTWSNTATVWQTGVAISPPDFPAGNVAITLVVHM